MNVLDKKLLFISNWAQGEALSGGDRIWIELAKRWADKVNISAYCSEEAKDMCRRLAATQIKFINTLPRLRSSSPFYNLLSRTLQAVGKMPAADAFDVVYSTSDFWPDFLPAFIMKLRKKNTLWIAGFFLFAPSPWQKDNPYKGRHFFIGLFYWLTQLPVYLIVKKYADIVFVTSEPDVKKFITKRRNPDRIVVIRGGVDIKPIEEYISQRQIPSLEKRKYDACFIGRFHYQKGVYEVLNIWRLVCAKRPEARLAMIGAGPLEKEVRSRIRNLNLGDNVDLLGFKDSDEKYGIFNDSKIILHPATYDSGGMAPAEAMAWGLPGVAFDLEALKTYYPQGMVKIPRGDYNAFALAILRLLTDSEHYRAMSGKAKELVAREWDWDKRADNIADKVYAILEQRDYL